jgi:hypothetical protein
VLVTWKLREEFDGKIIRRVGSLAAAKKTLAYEADANGSYTAIDPIPRRRGDRVIARRAFITLLGGAAAP